MVSDLNMVSVLHTFGDEEHGSLVLKSGSVSIETTRTNTKKDIKQRDYQYIGMRLFHKITRRRKRSNIYDTK